MRAGWQVVIDVDPVRWCTVTGLADTDQAAAEIKAHMARVQTHMQHLLARGLLGLADARVLVQRIEED